MSNQPERQIGFEQLGLGSVLGRHTLIVPANQREYSWTEAEISSLFYDLAKAIEYVMPPQVAALLRSGAATVPKAPERNWDALIEAARRKPRTDDDVLREKFGGGGKGGSDGTCQPLSAEPSASLGATQPAAPSSDNSVPRHDHERLQVRAQKNRYNDKIVYLNYYGRGFSYFSAMGGWHRDSVGDNMAFEDDGFEFTAQEALELWRSCATALNLDFETGYPPVRTQPPAGPSSEFCTKHIGIVISNGVSLPTEYTLTYYDTNTGGSGSIVLWGGAAS